jgi:hypothetical protein
VKKQLEKSNDNKKNNHNLMNEDLKQWLTEEDKADLSKRINKQLKHKKPKGMCQICGIKTAKVVCLKCGKSVCNACYFNIVGLCEKCISKETVEEWKKRKTDWERVLGVDWVD